MLRYLQMPHLNLLWTFLWSLTIVSSQIFSCKWRNRNASDIFPAHEPSNALSSSVAWSFSNKFGTEMSRHAFCSVVAYPQWLQILLHKFRRSNLLLLFAVAFLDRLDSSASGTGTLPADWTVFGRMCTCTYQSQWYVWQCEASTFPCRCIGIRTDRKRTSFRDSSSDNASDLSSQTCAYKLRTGIFFPFHFRAFSCAFLSSLMKHCKLCTSFWNELFDLTTSTTFHIPKLSGKCCNHISTFSWKLTLVFHHFPFSSSSFKYFHCWYLENEFFFVAFDCVLKSFFGLILIILKVLKCLPCSLSVDFNHLTVDHYKILIVFSTVIYLELVKLLTERFMITVFHR